MNEKSKIKVTALRLTAVEETIVHMEELDFSVVSNESFQKISIAGMTVGQLCERLDKLKEAHAVSIDVWVNPECLSHSLDNVFGDEEPITLKKGAVHEYLIEIEESITSSSPAIIQVIDCEDPDFFDLDLMQVTL